MNILPSPTKTTFVADCPYCGIGSAFGEQVGDEKVTVGYCDHCGATVKKSDSSSESEKESD